jgi:hypothetical protein
MKFSERVSETVKNNPIPSTIVGVGALAGAFLAGRGTAPEPDCITQPGLPGVGFGDGAVAQSEQSGNILTGLVDWIKNFQFPSISLPYPQLPEMNWRLPFTSIEMNTPSVDPKFLLLSLLIPTALLGRRYIVAGVRRYSDKRYYNKNIRTVGFSMTSNHDRLEYNKRVGAYNDMVRSTNDYAEYGAYKLVDHWMFDPRPELLEKVYTENVMPVRTKDGKYKYVERPAEPVRRDTSTYQSSGGFSPAAESGTGSSRDREQYGAYTPTSVAQIAAGTHKCSNCNDVHTIK